MLGHAIGSTLIGASALPISVEAFVGGGLPATIIVGLPDSAIKESRARIEAAIKSSGFTEKTSRTVVNLAPADIRKEGSGLDLAITMAKLVGLELVEQRAIDGYMFAAELALDGSLRAIPGAVIVARGCRDAGLKGLIVAHDNGPEAALISGIEVRVAHSLAHLVAALKGSAQLVIPAPAGRVEQADAVPCFSHVRGQATAKRALLVAAVGGHHVILSGPPGVGKTMLCERFVGLLPDLQEAEQMEVIALHSLSSTPRISARPPLRAPHHSLSVAALVGGGPNPRPGEISLAHQGVLFLDELAEFRTEALNALRQPMESGIATISRALRHVSFDARFQLIAATNPCPCGFLTHDSKPCTCSPREIDRYRQRLNGPISDRFDMRVNVSSRVSERIGGESTSALRKYVSDARAFARAHGRPLLNRALMGAQLTELVPQASQARRLLDDEITRLELSQRAVDRILRVSRSIADLAASPSVLPEHISEAASLRHELATTAVTTHGAHRVERGHELKTLEG